MADDRESNHSSRIRRARAAVNLAQEELRAGTAHAHGAVLHAIDQSRIIADDELRHVFRRFRDTIVERANSLGEIDAIIDEVTKLITPTKTPLRVKEDVAPTRVPLM